jgi:hypothetical protein
MERMDGKKKCRQERRETVLPPLEFLRKKQGDKIHLKRDPDVEDGVEEVIAEYIHAAKVIVQGKGQPKERAVEDFAEYRRDIGDVFYEGVLGNRIAVVEMKGIAETVEVRNERACGYEGEPQGGIGAGVRHGMRF